MSNKWRSEANGIMSRLTRPEGYAACLEEGWRSRPRIFLAPAGRAFRSDDLARRVPIVGLGRSLLLARYSVIAGEPESFFDRAYSFHAIKQARPLSISLHRLTLYVCVKVGYREMDPSQTLRSAR